MLAQYAPDCAFVGHDEVKVKQSRYRPGMAQSIPEI